MAASALIRFIGSMVSRRRSRRKALLSAFTCRRDLIDQDALAEDEDAADDLVLLHVLVEGALGVSGPLEAGQHLPVLRHPIDVLPVLLLEKKHQDVRFEQPGLFGRTA